MGKTSKSIKNLNRQTKRDYERSKEFYGKKVADERFGPTNPNYKPLLQRKLQRIKRKLQRVKAHLRYDPRLNKRVQVKSYLRKQRKKNKYDLYPHTKKQVKATTWGKDLSKSGVKSFKKLGKVGNKLQTEIDRKRNE